MNTKNTSDKKQYERQTNATLSLCARDEKLNIQVKYTQRIHK